MLGRDITLFTIDLAQLTEQNARHSCANSTGHNEWRLTGTQFGHFDARRKPPDGGGALPSGLRTLFLTRLLKRFVKPQAGLSLPEANDDNPRNHGDQDDRNVELA